MTVRARNDAPRNSRPPVITGQPETLSRLTLDRGDWNDNRDRAPGNLSYTYRWQVADDASGGGLSDIPGAAGLTYDVPSDFGGRYVRVKVTVRDDGEGTPSVRTTIRNTAYVQISASQTGTQSPVITQGASTTVSMDEDGAPNAFGLSLSATDDGGAAALTWAIQSAPTHGVAAASASGGSVDVDYVPDEDYSGDDEFDVRVTDANGNVDSIRVLVTVRPRNDAPQVETLPTVSGEPEPGRTLTATPGTWNDDRDTEPGSIQIRYKWQRSYNASNTRFRDIPGEENPDYRVTSDDTDRLVRIKVIATSFGEGTPNQMTGYAFSTPVPVGEGAITGDTIFEGSFE